ncbi:MAG: hypothetical protein ACYCXF_02150 [Thermoleophilia bacterium]
MKKKTIIAITAIGLVGALAFTVFVARNPGNALSDAYKKTITMEKEGKTFTIEGRKDTAAPTPQNAPKYDPNYNQWIGDPQAWAQIKQIVGDAMRTEREVMISTNLGSQEYKKKLRDYYSGEELQKREDWIKGELKAVSQGSRTTGAGISKMDFRGISIQGNQATAVVDVWSWAQYQDDKTGHTSNPKNGEQYTITLAQNNNQWIITKELAVFIPGYEP